jgi:limonene 1,2-monooxygenase
MRFGVFMAPFHTRQGLNPSAVLRRDLREIQLLDELGYDEAWVGEHHSAGAEIIASPEMFCAWAAGQTERIRLGTGVISLPYHNPLWVADRAVLLDNITRGRFMLGVGPGLLAFDAAMVGLDPGAVRDYLQEDFPVLMHLLRSEESLTVETSRYRLVDARVQLAPYSDFDVAVTSVLTPSGPLLAGRHGVGLLQLSGLTPEGMAVLPEHWKVMQSQAATYGTTVSRDQWRVVGIIHIAETRDQAIEEVRYGLDDYFDYAQYVAGGAVHLLAAGSTFDDRLAWATSTGFALVGTPDDAIAKLGELIDASQGGIGAFLFWAQEWTTSEARRRNYELFAERVMPVFQGSLRRPAAARQHAVDHLGELASQRDAGTRRFLQDHVDSVSSVGRRRLAASNTNGEVKAT